MGPVGGTIRRGNVTISAAQLFGSSDTDDLDLPQPKKACQESCKHATSNAAQPTTHHTLQSNCGALTREAVLGINSQTWSSSPSWHDMSIRQLTRQYHTEALHPPASVQKSVYFISKDDLSPDDLATEPPPVAQDQEQVVKFGPSDSYSSQQRAAERENAMKERQHFQLSQDFIPLESDLGEDVDDDDQPVPEVLPAVIPREIFLSAEQRYVLNLVVRQKKSIFFTGAAGTGKSVLLRRIISDLRRRSVGYGKVAVTASTGIAAFNIGGSTVHRFAGIGLGKEDKDALLKRVRANRLVKRRWQTIQTLIIDEISMVPAELLDKLDYIARKVRRQPNKAFGGIQVIFTGDFFQLPPIIAGDLTGNQFAFDAECWKECIERTIVLKQVFRQKDTRFSSMLDEMRRGILSPETIATFQALNRTPKVPPGIAPTQLFARRFEVERANETELRKLQSEGHTFLSSDEYNEEIPFQVKLDDLIAPPKITLKVGAQVMMVKNIDEKLVNGSIGKVIGFMDEATFALYDTEGHDDADLFDPSVLGAHDELDGTDDAVVRRKRARARFLNQMARNGEARMLPVVEFRNLDGTSRTILVHPEVWSVDDAEGKWMARRTQIPLILAWALSIHKSQGQTLEYAMVDLGNVFERGQAYVALSRVTALDGLQVKNFDPRKVKVHEKVLDFYDGLEEIQAAELRQPGLRMFFAEAGPSKESEEKVQTVETCETIFEESLEPTVSGIESFAYRPPPLAPDEFGNSLADDDDDLVIDRLHSKEIFKRATFSSHSSGFP